MLGVGFNAAALRWGWLVVPAEKPLTPEGPLAKSDSGIMEILEAFDLTRCAWSAAQLVGCDPKTVAAYVARRDAGVAPFSRLRRRRLVDPFLAKVEELVDHSQAKIRADVVHQRLVRWGSVGWSGRDRRSTPPRLAGAVACAGQDLGSQE